MKLAIAETQKSNAFSRYYVSWTKMEFEGFLKLAKTGKVKKDGYYYKTTKQYLANYIYSYFSKLPHRFDVKEEDVIEEQEALRNALETMNAKQFADLVAIIAEPYINLEEAD